MKYTKSSSQPRFKDRRSEKNEEQTETVERTLPEMERSTMAENETENGGGRGLRTWSRHRSEVVVQPVVCQRRSGCSKVASSEIKEKVWGEEDWADVAASPAGCGCANRRRSEAVGGARRWWRCSEAVSEIEAS